MLLYCVKYIYIYSRPNYGDVGLERCCIYIGEYYNTDRICEKGSYSLSKYMYFSIHKLICVDGTNLKFGRLTLLTPK